MRQKDEPLIKIWTKFLDVVTKQQSLSAIFLIFSIFSNRKHTSLFSRKDYDKLITMSGKKGGVPMLVGELWPFFNWQSSISRQIHHVPDVRVHEGAQNDVINYVQERCAMQMRGITLRLLSSIPSLYTRSSSSFSLVKYGRFLYARSSAPASIDVRSFLPR